MTCFLLSCLLGVANTGSIYFKNINDCLYYSKRLSGQTMETEEGTKTYKCICKVVPYVNPKKVKVY